MTGRTQQRSVCPINLGVELLGDRWSLLVVRDVMFGGKRYFRELQRGSMEGIAPNVLSDRLKRLVAEGLLSTRPDPDHRQRVVYSLTEASIDLVPLLVELGGWGRRHLPAGHALSVRIEVLQQGGPSLVAAFQDELRRVHVGDADPGDLPVTDRLRAAYESAVAAG